MASEFNPAVDYLRWLADLKDRQSRELLAAKSYGDAETASNFQRAETLKADAQILKKAADVLAKHEGEKA